PTQLYAIPPRRSSDLHLTGEILQDGQVRDPATPLLLAQFVDRRAAGPRPGTGQRVAHLAAVHGQPFHVHQFETVPTGHLVDRRRAEEEEMFVVYLVVSRLSQDGTEIGVRDYDCPVRLQ